MATLHVKNMADFWCPLLCTHNGRALQSSLASCSRPHPLQSRRTTHLASSEWQCSSVPVVLLHPSRWRAISIETPIIHLWPTHCSILQPHYCRQSGLSSLRRQSLEQSPCTSHISTATHSFPAASSDFSLPTLQPWPNYAYLTLPSLNSVVDLALHTHYGHNRGYLFNVTDQLEHDREDLAVQRVHIILDVTAP